MEILSKSIIYKGWSELALYKIRISDKKNGTVDVNREIFNSGDGATVFLYDPLRRKVMLTKQFRLAAFLNGYSDGRMIETCAGIIDDNNPNETIIKEILEETGLKVNEVTEVLSSFATPGAHMEKINFFIATYSEENKISEGGGLAEEFEDIEVIEYEYEEVINLYKSKMIHDAKTIIMIQYAIIEGIIS